VTPYSSVAITWSPIDRRRPRRDSGPLNILHFDAHPDLYDKFEGDPLSHASPFARIMEQGLARRLVTSGNQDAQRTLPGAGGSVRRRDNRNAKLRSRCVPIPAPPLYVSIDLDALDPAFAPGVSHHEPAGCRSGKSCPCFIASMCRCRRGCGGI
jgi:arginase family enzyme